MNFNEVRKQKKRSVYWWNEGDKDIGLVPYYKAYDNTTGLIQEQARFHIVRGTMQCVIREIRQLLKP